MISPVVRTRAKLGRTTGRTTGFSLDDVERCAKRNHPVVTARVLKKASVFSLFYGERGNRSVCMTSPRVLEFGVCLNIYVPKRSLVGCSLTSWANAISAKKLSWDGAWIMGWSLLLQEPLNLAREPRVLRVMSKVIQFERFLLFEAGGGGVKMLVYYWS